MSAANANQNKTAKTKASTANKQDKQTDLLLTLLRELQSIDPEFPLQYALCLLEVAQDEGQSLTTLSETTGMPLSTISRIIGALSDHRQRGEPYGLVEVTISAAERRRKEITLTAKGKNLIEKLHLILQTR